MTTPEIPFEVMMLKEIERPGEFDFAHLSVEDARKAVDTIRRYNQDAKTPYKDVNLPGLVRGQVLPNGARFFFKSMEQEILIPINQEDHSSGNPVSTINRELHEAMTITQSDLANAFSSRFAVNSDRVTDGIKSKNLPPRTLISIDNKNNKVSINGRQIPFSDFVEGEIEVGNSVIALDRIGYGAELALSIQSKATLHNIQLYPPEKSDGASYLMNTIEKFVNNLEIHNGMGECVLVSGGLNDSTQMKITNDIDDATKLRLQNMKSSPILGEPGLYESKFLKITAFTGGKYVEILVDLACYAKETGRRIEDLLDDKKNVASPIGIAFFGCINKIQKALPSR